MSSTFGFVDKDNEFSNLTVKDILDAKTTSFQNLLVTNLTVANTITNSSSSTSSSSVTNLKVFNTLEINNQLVFKSALPSEQIVFENSKTGASITLNCQTISNPGITYTIPDVGVNFSNFVMTDGAQTINGAKIFTSPINITNTANQLILGTGGLTTTISATAPVANRVYTIPGTGATITLTAPTPAVSRSYTIPDVGFSSTFLMSLSSSAQAKSM